MRFNRLKIFPFHVFLLPIFFVWHIVNGYFGMIPFEYSARFALYYIGLAAFLFFLGKIFFKNNTKAGCWATALLIVFFFWGAFHDFLKSLPIPAPLLSYKYLLFGILLIFITLTVKLNKKAIPPYKTSLFLTMLFGVLLITEAGTSIYKWSDKQHLKNNLAYYNDDLKLNLTASTKPDIFFIVFDEYASTASLKQYLNYDNSSFDSMLVKNNFFIANNSTSNYNSTPFSIASTLNFNYFNTRLEDIATGSKALLKATYSLEKSRLTPLLEKQGYEIKNLGLLDIEGHPTDGQSLFQHELPFALYKETLWYRVKSEIWWNIQVLFTPTIDPDKDKPQPVLSYTTDTSNFRKLTQELNTETSTPKFVIGHFLMPHSGYVVNEYGIRRKVSPGDDAPSIRDTLYLKQLEYVNYWIDSLAQAANKKTTRPRIVIIEGDHGRRDHKQPGFPYIRDKQFMNLSSFYFSDHDYTMLYDSMSTVNTFRVVLNKYFQAGLPLLKDSTIHLNNLP